MRYSFTQNECSIHVSSSQSVIPKKVTPAKLRAPMGKPDKMHVNTCPLLCTWTLSTIKNKFLCPVRWAPHRVAQSLEQNDSFPLQSRGPESAGQTLGLCPELGREANADPGRPCLPLQPQEVGPLPPVSAPWKGIEPNPPDTWALAPPTTFKIAAPYTRSGSHTGHIIFQGHQLGEECLSTKRNDPARLAQEGGGCSPSRDVSVCLWSLARHI